MNPRLPWATVRRPHAVEAATLALVLACTVLGCLLSGRVIPKGTPVWPGTVLAVVAWAALFWRRSRPLTVLAATGLCVMAQGALGYLLTPLLMAPLLTAQYSACLHTRRSTTWTSSLATAVGIVVAGLFSLAARWPLVLAVLSPAAWLLLFAALGSYVNVRRAYAADRSARAARERAEESRRHVMQERMRIARELHDVVAHHLTLAHAQASTAAHLSGTHPDQALDIVGQLPETTAAALRELKATVGLLRQDADPDDGLSPAPGLRQLPDLIAACRTAGLDVDADVRGRPRPLTPGLDLTAYRILQEALTNVTKHAVAHTARVCLAYTTRHLTLTVTNDTPPTPLKASSGAGFGLLGMRERAVSAGGTFEAGPLPGGGFRVVCALPVNSQDEGTSP